MRLQKDRKLMNLLRSGHMYPARMVVVVQQYDTGETVSKLLLEPVLDYDVQLVEPNLENYTMIVSAVDLTKMREEALNGLPG